MEVIRLKPGEYVHLLDHNDNVSRLMVGPVTYTKKDEEMVLFQPKKCITVPPRHYCRVRNPVIRGADNQPVERHGQVVVRTGQEEIRLEQEPFPLYPGEVLVEERGKKTVQPLQVVPRNSALRLRATEDITDGKETRIAGEEWLFVGPKTYVPRVEVTVVTEVKAQIIQPNEALKMRAVLACVDSNGTEHQVGDEWLVTTTGAYLPRVEEEVVNVVKARVLTEKKALQLEATQTFVDVFGKKRLAGSQWLVTQQDAATHLPNVHEKVIGDVPLTTLTNRQYCVVLDPVDEHLVPQFGKKEVRKGEVSFFLQPGESLESGIQNVIILADAEALLLRAVESFQDADVDGKPVRRGAGEKWMIHGPCEYVPPVEVTLVGNKRQAMALDKNEGVYVRDEKTGSVRSVIGSSYLLSPTEVLWEKVMNPHVEDLMRTPNGMVHTVKDKPNEGRKPPRDPHRVVRFSVQHNAAVQVYDFRQHTSRIVLGPDVVMLAPDEEFTVVSLSGDKPKRPNVIKGLQLFLGPDFMTDYVQVETADHARLEIKLSYNWRFRYDVDNPNANAHLFAVPDFVGATCGSLASKVRAAVAKEQFDAFHQHSARVLRVALFGLNEEGRIRDELVFPSNQLVITNVDIHTVEVVDQKTRESLEKSMRLAVEISSKSVEASARHEASRREQEAQGKLERQVIKDKAAAEAGRKNYLVISAEAEAIESSGTAVADAESRAEAAKIECSSEVEQAKLRAQAAEITILAEVAQMRAKQTSELAYHQRMNDLEVTKAKELAEIESKKFGDTVDSIGKDTLLAIAQSGPEMQAKLLEGLGLKGYLITDGQSPINLFNTASGMVGGMGMQQ